MIKLKNIINYSFLIFLGLVFLLNLLFKDKGSYSTRMTFSPLWIVFLVLTVGGIIYLSILSSGLINRLLIRYHKLIIISLFIFYIAAQIIFLKKFIVTPSWDFGNVIDGSIELLKNHQLTPYLLLFQNNIPVALLLSFFNLIGFKSIFSLGLLNIIFIDLALIYLLLAIKKIFKNNIYSIFIATIFFISFLPFLFYVPIVYTDTLSLPFVTMGIYYFISKAGKITDNIYGLILALLSISIGALIKPSLIIILIAAIIVLFIYHKKKYYCLLPLIVFLAINFAYTSAIWSGKVINNMQKGVHMPQTHYLMMGQNTQSLGIYYGEDVALDQEKIKQGVPIKQIESENIHLAIERISERGFKGNLSFTILKISKTWNEPDFYSLNKLNRHPINPQFIAFLQQNKVLAFILDSFYLTILCLSLYAIWRSVVKREEEPEIFMLLKLSLLGIFIFLIFWETRSRYLLNFIPLLLLYATYGLHLLVEKKVNIKQSKMKILIIAQDYSPTRVASTVRVERMVKTLTRKHQVTVLTGFPIYNQKTLPPEYRFKFYHRTLEDGIKIYRTYTYFTQSLQFLPRLWTQLSFMFSSFIVGLFLEKPDLIIVTSPPLFTGLSATALSFCRKVKLVVDIRDLWPESAVALNVIKSPFLIDLASRSAQLMYRQASQVIVTTPKIYCYLKNKYPTKNINLLVNATDTKFFKPIKVDKTKYGYKRTDFIVSYMGNMGKAQSLTTIIKAAEILKNKKNIKFLLVGKGDDEDRIRHRARNLKNLKFMGYQTKEEILNLINLSDVCLISLAKNKLFEGAIPSKTFEYMACCKPVIACVKGDIETIIANKKTGLIVPPENQKILSETILNLKTDGTLRKKVAKNSYELVKNDYSDEKFRRNLETILNNRF